MIKQLIVIFSLCAFFASAQKGKTKNEPAPPTEPTTRPSVDSILGFAMYDGFTPWDAVDYQLPPESETDPVTGKKTIFKEVKRSNDSIRKAFRIAYKKRLMTPGAYTKKPMKEGDKMKLCVNIVHKDTSLLYCVVDSTTRFPEFYKVMFEKQNGDSVYKLLYVYAFSKQGGNCNGEKEAKLMFVRWNVKQNQAIWRTKLINSCAKTVTNMSKTPIEEWDGKSPLVVEYHRGNNFNEISFDPEHPEKGFQNNKETTKASSE